MVVAESLAIGALVKVGNKVLDHVAPFKKHADSPRYYDQSQGFRTNPIPFKKLSPSQLEALSKLLDEGKFIPKSKVNLKSHNKSRPELVSIPENERARNDTIESKYYSVRDGQENDRNQRDKIETKHFSVREEQEKERNQEDTIVYNDNSIIGEEVEEENQRKLIESKYNPVPKEQEKKSNERDANDYKYDSVQEEKEKRSNQKETIESKYPLVQEGQERNSKTSPNPNGDDDQRSEFVPSQESNRPYDTNREADTNTPVKPELIEDGFTNIKNDHKSNARKLDAVESRNYFQVDMTSKKTTFIPIETRIILDETTVWTGNRYTKEVDSSIYDIHISDDTECLYTEENGPGSCFIKSHEGFYLMGQTYFSKPFDCNSDSSNVKVKRAIEFEEWEISFNSPLSTLQLVELIKPPLPPAPQFNRLSFDITCSGRGVKRVAFKPLYYKVRGLSYNIESKFDVSESKSIFQDIHFPVLLASGIVHGVYTVVD